LGVIETVAGDPGCGRMIVGAGGVTALLHTNAVAPEDGAAMATLTN